MEAIAGNRLAPGLLDIYLAKTGFDSQQTHAPEDPDRPNNLWSPVEGAHSTEGDFSARSRRWSPQLWGDLHIGILGGGALALVAGALISATCFNKDAR